MPFLPELLDEPIQIIIQSTPTDWWSIGGTVLGAAIGAGLGAYFSYFAAKRAAKADKIHDNAKSAVKLIELCRSDIHEAERLYIECLRSNSNEIYQERQNAFKIASDRANELHLLLAIYFPYSEPNRHQFFSAFVKWYGSFEGYVGKATTRGSPPGVPYEEVEDRHHSELEAYEKHHQAENEYLLILSEMSEAFINVARK
ncbi:hypothetical protein [Vreelandella neptunia]|uniref:Uncharacterized protein n=1 Tax=Vreelandella neptunia TaxID=115551 RepID=A0ABZ0YTN4_9GAMM|nr:hypothetical protein [Halomonas neptunia]MDN3561704.1 hypothetical protein [Halomonas neptunia]WQH14606.1 hypothetical protein SR894_08715 [Halomonas neptunia]